MFTRRVAIVAGVGLAVLGVLPGCHAATPSAGPTGASPPPATPTPIPTTAGATLSPGPDGCGRSPVGRGSLPEWTASAGLSGGRFVLAHEANLVGVLFPERLVAPPNTQGAANKILWISREPREGSALRLTLSPTAGGAAVTVTQPANSSPGEIYPSIVDVPAAGCWSVVAEWAGHRATLELLYEPN